MIPHIRVTLVISPCVYTVPRVCRSMLRAKTMRRRCSPWRSWQQWTPPSIVGGGGAKAKFPGERGRRVNAVLFFPARALAMANEMHSMPSELMRWHIDPRYAEIMRQTLSRLRRVNTRVSTAVRRIAIDSLITTGESIFDSSGAPLDRLVFLGARMCTSCILLRRRSFSLSRFLFFSSGNSANEIPSTVVPREFEKKNHPWKTMPSIRTSTRSSNSLITTTTTVFHTRYSFSNPSSSQGRCSPWMRNCPYDSRTHGYPPSPSY